MSECNDICYKRIIYTKIVVIRGMEGNLKEHHV